MNRLISESATAAITRHLLTDNLVGKSKIVALLQKIYIRNLTEIFLLATLISAWYEVLITKYLAFSYFPAVFLLLAVIFCPKEKVVFRKAHLWYLLFLTASALSGFVAVAKNIPLTPILLGLFLFIQFFLVIVAAQTITRKIRFLKITLWASLPLTVVGFAQFLSGQKTSPLWVSASEDIVTRAFGFFGSPNVFGALLVIMATLSIGIYLSEKNKLYVILSIANPIALFFTFSRSAWIAGLGALLCGLYYFRRKWLALSPAILILALVPQVRDRIANVFTPSYLLDSSLDGRIWSLNNGFYILKNHLFLGTGPGSYGGQTALASASPVYLEGLQKGYTALYFTDNQILEILVQTGIVGLFCFSLFLASFIVFAHVRYNLTANPLFLTAILSVIAFTIAGMFGNVLEFGAIVLPVGLIIGVALGEDPQKDSPSL